MSEAKQNYYGELCTELYEILHEKAPQDELDFYLSYAGKDKKILEPLCGSGRRTFCRWPISFWSASAGNTASS